MPFIPHKLEQETLVEVGPIRVKTTTANRLQQIADKTGVGLDQAVAQYLDYSIQIGLITDRKRRAKKPTPSAAE